MHPNPSMTLLQLRNIKKSFAKRPILDNLNLDVERGEFVCILGSSGSGKTTLLRLMAGFEKIDNGTIILDGVTIASPNTHIATEKRGIGIVFQDHALWPHMTVFENVAFPLRIQNKGNASIKQRVQQILADIAMIGFETKYPHELSGGEAQRIALARTLIQEPKVIIFDEPLSSLDSLRRYELQGVIKKLHTDKGLTSIYITHDRREAMRLGDRIAILEDGLIKQYAEPETIYKEPRTTTIAKLLGQSNCLFATILNVKNNTATVQINDYIFSVRTEKTSTYDSLPQPITLSVRPEDIQLHADDALGLKCIITECYYGGGEYSIELSFNTFGKDNNSASEQTLRAKSATSYTCGTIVSCTVHDGWVIPHDRILA
ncbi:MAG: ABC transporter ATP-binding protein [Alphaproteobacteria bacterium]|nr:ABC transporter ATP-binding protein [Alphaproteobacteria bacterium]